MSVTLVLRSGEQLTVSIDDELHKPPAWDQPRGADGRFKRREAAA